MRTPEAVVLHEPATGIVLEPLTAEHLPELLAAGRPDTDEVFRWTAPSWRPMHDEAGARWGLDLALAEVAAGARIAFVVRDATGAIAGSTSYRDLAPEDERLEIGSTWLGRAWWRTEVNTAAKLVLLRHAFDELGAFRVGLKTDHLNRRSRAAIARLGAVEEGSLRAHIVRPDGSRRDTVHSSILAPEWPTVRDRLTERLARG